MAIARTTELSASFNNTLHARQTAIQNNSATLVLAYIMTGLKHENALELLIIPIIQLRYILLPEVLRIMDRRPG